MDAYFRKLRQDGIGVEIKHTGVISKEEESLLWERGILGTSTPLALLRSVFYYNGKIFCLRGGEEHRQLKFSQLKRVEKGFVYTENGSKNRSGGVAQMRVENKVVPSYAVHEIGERCHVYLLDMYLKKVPKDALDKNNFYLRPQRIASDTDGVWYMPVPVGRNTLQKMLPAMCEEAGIARRTNHSLRATGATQLFNANIPEKVIQCRTGHRSLKALRMYENPTDEQQSEACQVLVSKEKLLPPELLSQKPEQLLPGVAAPQASIVPVHCTTTVPPLFGAPQNCTINIQVLNQPSIQNFQGFVNSDVSTKDDAFVDSLLSSVDVNLI